MTAVLRGSLGKTPLDATVLTIGSSPANQLVIDDVKVSAHHAEIRPEGSRYSITDLGSTHGTYVNSQRLDWNTAYSLTPGSSITIGDTTFIYQEGDEAADTEPKFDEAHSNGVSEAAPAAAYALPPRRSRRRWLWIGLIILVILGIAGGAAAVYFTRATPEKTIDTFCNALRGQDYASAYALLSSNQQKTTTEAEFAAKQLAIGHTTICTHNNANVTGNVATDKLTMVSGGQSYSGIISLISENGAWKISVLLSSPALTLTIFCNALRTGDTHTAYNEYSQGLKNANSEAAFAQTFGGITCEFSSVTTSGNVGRANIVFVNSSGPSNPYVVLLVQDPANNSDWRIDSIEPS